MSNLELKQTSITRYNQKLTRKLILVILPFIIVPILILGAVLYFSGNISNIQLMMVFVGITLLIGILSVIILSTIIHNQVVRPIKTISEITEDITKEKVDKKLSIKRRDEIGLLMDYINQISETFDATRSNLDSISSIQLSQIKTCAAIAINSTTANSIDDLLQKTASSIREEFSHYLVVFYLKSKSGDKLSIKSIASDNELKAKNLGNDLFLDDESLVTLVATKNELLRSTDVSSDPLFKPRRGFEETRSELALPISIDNEVYGVLDLHDLDLDGFSSEEISILQAISNIIAVYIHNFGIISNARFDPRISAYLFNASYQILHASNKEVIFQYLTNVLRRLPFVSSLYFFLGSEWKCMLHTDPEGNVTEDIPARSISFTRKNLGLKKTGNYPIYASGMNNHQDIMSEELFLFAQGLDYNNLILYPLFDEQTLQGLLFLGTKEEEPIHANLVNAVSRLIDITEKSLTNNRRNQSSKYELDHLSVLNITDQYLSEKIAQHDFLAAIHQQALNTIGETDFQVLLYSKKSNMIETPYHYDGEIIRKYPPAPLDKGLITSIIRSGEPIILLDEQAIIDQDSGISMVSDGSAKSWLGVPILVGEEIFGTIVVRDFKVEKRFNEADLIILTTLASYIGITLDSRKSFIGSSRFTEQEQTVSAFASRLSQSMDIDNILKMAVLQLGQLPGIQDASIHIKPPKPQ